MRHSNLAALILLASCDGSSARLVVQLRTDLVPGREFTLGRVTLASESGAPQERTLAADAASAWGHGVRLGEIGDLEPGSYMGRLSLELGDRVVVERPFRVELDDGVFVFTVLLTRDCFGVTCDDPGANACIGGRCVPDECTEDNPAACPDVDCTSEADCAESDFECGTVECTASGACFVTLDHDECLAGRCDPGARACVPDAPPGAEWLHLIRGVGGDDVNDVALGSGGEVYAVGDSASDPVDIGGVVKTRSRAGEGGFLARFGDRGAHWAELVESTRSIALFGVATNGPGGVYVSGWFAGTSSLGDVAIVATSPQDALIASFDVTGRVSWVHQSPGDGAFLGIAHTGSELAIGGHIRRSFAFGSATPNPSSMTLAIFVGWMGLEGRPRDALLWDGPSDDTVLDLDTRGRITCVGGQTAGDIVLGDVPHVSENTDGWLLVLGDGAVTGARFFGTAMNDWVQAVAATDDGCIVAGVAWPSLDLGAGPQVGHGDRDLFVARYDATAELVWAHVIGGPDGDSAQSLAVDGLGRVYLGGTFAGTADLLAGTRTSDGMNDGFVLALEADGSPRWVKLIGGGGSATPLGLDVSDDGSLVAIGGTFSGAIDFAGTMSDGDGDGFVARIAADP